MPEIRSLIPALVLVLCVCDKPANGSSPPIVGAADANGKPIVGGGGGPAGSDPAANPGDGGSNTGGGASAANHSSTVAAPPPCQPALDDDPTGFFSHRMLIRLPQGVELIEENPFYARSVGANQASSCGTQVYFTAVGYLRSMAPLTDVRKYILQLRGISAETVQYSGEQNLGSQLTVVYEAPQSQSGAPPVRGWMLLRRDGGFVYWTLMEAHPSNFASLEGTFKAATSSLIIRSVKSE